ncbi:MAG: hypothetical protein ACOC8D_01380 [bacterium]
MRRVCAVIIFLAACAPGWAAEGEPPLSAEVTAGFDGWFRPGYPVPFRVRITNREAALAGQLELVVEGITYRRPLQVGAGATATVELLAAVHSAAATVALRVRGQDGGTLMEKSVRAALRERSEAEPLVVVTGANDPLSAGLRAHDIRVVELAPERLPRTAAAYLGLDAVAGRWADLAGAGQAIEGFVGHGGLAAMVLDPDGVTPQGVGFGDLGGAGAGLSAAQWLGQVSRRPGVRAIADGVTCREGLGRLAAGKASAPFVAAVAGLIQTAAARRRGGGDPTIAPELYEAFGDPVWTRGSRRHLALATLAMVAVVALVARFVPLGWRWWQRGVAAVWAAGLVGVIAWAAFVPRQPVVLDSVVVASMRSGERAVSTTSVLCLAGVREGRASVNVGPATQVVPVYRRADEVGSWDDVIVELDSGDGNCFVRFDVRADVRRCLVIWRGMRWGVGADIDEGAGERLLVRRRRFKARDEWRSLRRLERRGDLKKGLLRWQARQWAGGGAFRASWARQPWKPWHLVGVRGGLEERYHPAMFWVGVEEE